MEKSLLLEKTNMVPLKGLGNLWCSTGQMSYFLEQQFYSFEHNISISRLKISEMFKSFCVLFSYGILAAVLTGWVFFDPDQGEFQGVRYYPLWSSVNLNLLFGVDGVSILFLILTALIFPCCFLVCKDLRRGEVIMFHLLCMELLLLAAFSVLDLFFFCLFFESLVIPMVFLILEWGGKDRRILALTYFFMYTMLGSVFLITALFIYYVEFNTTSFAIMLQPELFNTMSLEKQRVFWICLFLTFAIKIPVFPFHIWLPEAHVEAPTVGSIILAGLLLKLGGYGIIRFLAQVEDAKYFFQPFVLVLCLIGLFASSVMALEQQDIKRIIAYSSVAHMNFALLGFFTHTEYGYLGAICLMVSHGIVSAALFFLIGVIYNRTGDRDVKAILAVVNGMPIFCTLLFLFLLSNFSFPGTSNFVGEFLILLGIATTAFETLFLLALFSTFFGLVYSMLAYNRLTGGQKFTLHSNLLMDVTRVEAYCLLPLLFLNFMVGLGPTPMLITVYFKMKSLVFPASSFDWEKHLFAETVKWDSAADVNVVLVRALYSNRSKTQTFTASWWSAVDPVGDTSEVVVSNSQVRQHFKDLGLSSAEAEFLLSFHLNWSKLISFDTLQKKTQDETWAEYIHADSMIKFFKKQGLSDMEADQIASFSDDWMKVVNSDLVTKKTEAELWGEVMDAAGNSRKVREHFENDRSCTVGELEDLIFLSETGPTREVVLTQKSLAECEKELIATKNMPTRLQSFTTYYTTFVKEHLQLTGADLETAVQKGVAAFIAPADSMRIHRLGAAMAKDLGLTAHASPDDFFQREQRVEQFYRTFYANEGATGGVLESLVLITNVARVEARGLHCTNGDFVNKVLSMQSDVPACSKFLMGEGYRLASLNLLSLWGEKPFKSVEELLISGILFSKEATSIIKMKVAIENVFAEEQASQILDTPLTTWAELQQVQKDVSKEVNKLQQTDAKMRWLFKNELQELFAERKVCKELDDGSILQEGKTMDDYEAELKAIIKEPLFSVDKAWYNCIALEVFINYADKHKEVSEFWAQPSEELLKSHAELEKVLMLHLGGRERYQSLLMDRYYHELLFNADEKIGF